MKSFTVSDLRNHFAEVAKFIDSGEPVSITRYGAPFAILSPAKPAVTEPKKADWAARFARRKPVGRGLTAEETVALWSRLRD